MQSRSNFLQSKSMFSLYSSSYSLSSSCFVSLFDSLFISNSSVRTFLKVSLYLFSLINNCISYMLSKSPFVSTGLEKFFFFPSTSLITNAGVHEYKFLKISQIYSLTILKWTFLFRPGLSEFPGPNNFLLSIFLGGGMPLIKFLLKNFLLKYR